MENSTNEFDTQAWVERCEKLNKEAINGCGSSHHLYCVNYSNRVSAALAELPPEHQDAAVVIAKTMGDYLTPEELAEEIQDNKDSGACIHGIDPHCCPVGCGDLED